MINSYVKQLSLKGSYPIDKIFLSLYYFCCCLSILYVPVGLEYFLHKLGSYRARGARVCVRETAPTLTFMSMEEVARSLDLVQTLQSMQESMTKEYYGCHICGKSFRENHSLDKHIRYVHLKEKRFKCNICNQMLASNDLVKYHILMHSGEKPYKCKVCGKGFRTMQYRKVHTRTVHLREKRFFCGICGKGFSRNYCLKQHGFVHNAVKKFGCDICGKVYTRSENLDKHLKAFHLNEKHHTCEICGKEFYGRSVFVKHAESHAGIKNIECDLCGRKFAQTSQVNTHKRVVHFKEKPHMCKICGKRFSCKGYLPFHAVVHTGEKAFGCKVCGKHFGRESSLKIHHKSKSCQKRKALQLANC